MSGGSGQVIVYTGITDAFNRVESHPALGTSDAGYAWFAGSTTGGAAPAGSDLSVDGSRAHFRMGTISGGTYPGVRGSLPTLTLTESSGIIEIEHPTTSQLCSVEIAVGGASLLSIEMGSLFTGVRVRHGSSSFTATVTKTFTPGVVYSFRWENTTTLTRIRAWATSDAEPAVWDAEQTAGTLGSAAAFRMDLQSQNNPPSSGSQTDVYLDNLDIDGFGGGDPVLIYGR